MDDLTLGDLIRVAMQSGVGNYDRTNDEMVPWDEGTLADAIENAWGARDGRKAARRPSEDTIETWTRHDTNGPSPRYWTHLLKCFAPPGSAARVNDHWREALEQKRVDRLGKRKTGPRSRKRSTEDVVAIAPIENTDHDFDVSSDCLAAELETATTGFASPQAKVMRAIGVLEQHLLAPTSDTPGFLLARLLQHSLLRAAIQIDVGHRPEGGSWRAWRLALEASVAADTGFTADHLAIPETYPLFAGFADAIEGLFDIAPDQIAEVVSEAVFEELGQSLMQYRPLIDALLAPLSDASARMATLQFTCHHVALGRSLRKPMLSDEFARGGEPFSLLEMYVDLPVEPDVGAIEDHTESYGDEDVARMPTWEAFRGFLNAPWRLQQSRDNFLCIRGLPGSGKSTASKINVDRLRSIDPDLAVILLPLQKHGPFLDSDQTVLVRGETPSGFLPNSAGLDIVALFSLSRFRRLLVVLDGLDELGSQYEHQHQVAALSRALRLVDRVTKPKPVKFVLAGRHQAFRHLSYPRLRDEEVYRLIGMARPKLAFQREGPRIEESDLAFVFDYRMEWFERFMLFKYGLADRPGPACSKAIFISWRN
ncbi:MAG: hypothetical protein KDK28_00050 [Maritimibacter sp.]|nr:hypothetical protein [Maritimibacter sp.]